MKRCTNCGKYPFCKLIDENNIAVETVCQYWVKRRLLNENNTRSEFETGKNDS